MDNPIIALMYDFDRTLSVEDMQNFMFIPSLGMDTKSFWDYTNAFGKENKMDGILSYMYIMLAEAKKKNLRVTEASLKEMGRNIRFFPGVETWFRRITNFGLLQGVTVEHYVISSGLKEIINGCSIHNCFKEIFASEFIYNELGEPVWPKTAVNYTNKTQFIYRINKGIFDASDSKINASMPEENKRVRFENMIYLGDGLSDVPCMKMVKSYGGKSIAVYQDTTENAVKLIEKDRVDFVYPADYSANSPLEKNVKNIIRSMAIRDQLYRESRAQKEIYRSEPNEAPQDTPEG